MQRPICGLTSITGTSVEPSSEGMRHTSRLQPSQPRATRRQTNKAAGAPQAAVLRERARIARELHDGVSQTLYAITLGASRA